MKDRLPEHVWQKFPDPKFFGTASMYNGIDGRYYPAIEDLQATNIRWKKQFRCKNEPK